LLDNNKPESFKMERFIVSDKIRGKNAVRRSIVSLRRCRPPQPLHVEMKGQHLSTLTLHGKRYTVEQVYGPWRKSGSWWSPEVWSSEEWDVQAVAGADDILLCLITHDLLRHRWQLEAHYD
jgi:protein ImuB